MPKHVNNVPQNVPTIESSALAIASHLSVTNPKAAMKFDYSWLVQILVSILSNCVLGPREIRERAERAAKPGGDIEKAFLRRRIRKHLRQASVPKEEMSATITAIATIGANARITDIKLALAEAARARIKGE